MQISSNIIKSNEIVIPVIASFNIKGDILPLYFQYDNRTVSLSSVRIVSKIHACIVYDCMAELEGYSRNVKITYRSQLHIWTLYV